MKESTMYELVFGESERLEVIVSADITVRLSLGGAHGSIAFPSSETAIDYLQALKTAYSKTHPLLSGVDAIIEKLGGKKEAVQRRPPRKAA